jgi:hypothetical protein
MVVLCKDARGLRDWSGNRIAIAIRHAGAVPAVPPPIPNHQVFLERIKQCFASRNFTGAPAFF